MSDPEPIDDSADRYGTPAERAALLISVASASVAFMLAFNLGAYGEVFFDQIFTVWIASTLVSLGSIFTRLPPHTWPPRLVLWLTLMITVIALPFAAWILVSTINPDFRDLTRNYKIVVGAVVVVAFAAGYGIGARNDVLLTCDDFKVSGNDLPANCVKLELSSS